MTKAEFIAWATSHGWTQDKWGHLHSKGGGYRFKLSSVAVQYEMKTGLGWVRIASNFFSRVDISSEGKLTGLIMRKQQARKRGSRFGGAMTLEQFREHTKNLPGSTVVDLCVAGDIIGVHEIIIFELDPGEYYVELFDETACEEAGIEPIWLASEATL